MEYVDLQLNQVAFPKQFHKLTLAGVNEKSGISIEYQKYRVNVLARSAGKWARKATQVFQIFETNHQRT